MIANSGRHILIVTDCWPGHISLTPARYITAKA